MRLLVEVFGVLVAAALIRGARDSVRWPFAVAAVAAVGGIVAVCNTGLTTASSFREQRAAFEALSPAQLNDAGGAAMGAREDFLAFADAHMPRRAKVFLHCTPGCNGLEQWITWRLLPRAFVDRIGDADWIVLYHAQPRDVGLRGRSARAVLRFGKGFSIAPIAR